MPIRANEVGPTPGLGFSGFYTTAANGGVSQLVDVTGGFLGGLHEGSKVWVESFRDSFTWYPLSTETADNVTVVTPTVVGAGAGRFIRDQIGSPTWAKQATWYVDPSNGLANDENSGLTNLLPLKTASEMTRRIGHGSKIDQVTTLYIQSSLSATDPLSIVYHFGTAGSLRVIGAATVVSGPSTFTGVTAINPATNTSLSVTDGALASFAPFVGYRLRITSGARANAVAWVAKDLGANSARTSSFATYSGTAPLATYNAGGAEVTPVIGDPYVIESLVQVPDLVLGYSSSQNATANPSDVYLWFENVAFTGVAGAGAGLGAKIIHAPYALTLWLGCDLRLVSVSNGYIYSVGCRHSSVAVQTGFANLWIQSGLIAGPTAVVVGMGVHAYFANNTLFQACKIWARRGGTAVCTSCGVFDANSYGVRVDGAGGLRLTTLYGSGNATVGLEVDAGAASCHYTGTVAQLTITGAGGDLQVGGAVPATGVRTYDDATGAWSAVKVATTWANVAAATPGGFGGHVVNPMNNAALVKEE